MYFRYQTGCYEALWMIFQQAQRRGQKGLKRMKKFLVSGYDESQSMIQYRMEDAAPAPVWSCGLPSPSFCCVADELCFAAAEREQGGDILCLRREGEGYVQTDVLPVSGGFLCHLWYAPRHKTVYGACYGDGLVVAARVEDGHFREVTSRFIVGEEEHALTRAHCCVPDAEETFLYVSNIALDRVYCYQIQPDGGLRPNPAFPYLQLAKGEGPRHIHFHPSKEIVYVITEYSSKLFVLARDPKSGALSVMQEVSALPADYSGKSVGSSLAVSPDGRYLYGANRGANTVAAFSIAQDGTLKKIQDIGCGGNWPRHIALSKDGRFLFVANQQSNDVSLFSVSQEDGTLKATSFRVPVKSPSFVVDVTE